MANKTGVADAAWATETTLVDLLHAAQEGGNYSQIVQRAELDTSATAVASLLGSWRKKGPETPERQYADLFHRLKRQAPKPPSRSARAAAAALLTFNSICECGSEKDPDQPACSGCLALATDRSRRQSSASRKEQQLADALDARVKSGNGRHPEPVGVN